MKSWLGLLLVMMMIAGCTTSPPPQNGSNGTPNVSNNTTTVPPGYEASGYCQQDSDCVRLKKCCDCGMGEYVNIYHQAEPACGGPECACASALSHGECRNNSCVAVQNITAPPNQAGISFESGQGACGNETAPVRYDSPAGIEMSGSVGDGSVCRTAQGQLVQEDGFYVLNITTRAIPGVAACINCMGEIPWQANISGYNGLVMVYYDGRQVFPPSSGFCGISTNGTCTADSDCISGGCSGQVCQSASEQPVITTCEYRDCYSARFFGVSCGCDAGKCRWK